MGTIPERAVSPREEPGTFWHISYKQLNFLFPFPFQKDV